MVAVHNFSYGVLNPGLAFAMSCLGSYLGLRCVILSRAYDGAAKARWLVLASIAIGAVGIWSMHFIAMLGFSVPGEPIRYNILETIASMLLAVAVVGAGLFIVGFGDGGLGQRVAASGGGEHASLRRLVTDLIEEYGRHTGHADFLREAADGLTGEDPPQDWRPKSGHYRLPGGPR